MLRVILGASYLVRWASEQVVRILKYIVQSSSNPPRFSYGKRNTVLTYLMENCGSLKSRNFTIFTNVSCWSLTGFSSDIGYRSNAAPDSNQSTLYWTQFSIISSLLHTKPSWSTAQQTVISIHLTVGDSQSKSKPCSSDVVLYLVCSVTDPLLLPT